MTVTISPGWGLISKEQMDWVRSSWRDKHPSSLACPTMWAVCLKEQENSERLERGREYTTWLGHNQHGSGLLRCCLLGCLTAQPPEKLTHRLRGRKSKPEKPGGIQRVKEHLRHWVGNMGKSSPPSTWLWKVFLIYLLICFVICPWWEVSSSTLNVQVLWAWPIEGAQSHALDIS